MAYEDAIGALADPTRRAVFERLRHGPRPVGEIARGLPVSRPAVSQHLRVLRQAGLVRERRDGTRRYYSVDGAGLADVRSYIEGFWGEALDAFKAAAESDEGGAEHDAADD
jgi:DNA-binding transcriptional ArsR family regulator